MAKAERKESHSEEQARLQLECIKEMVAALECDYDRLEELKDELSTTFDDWETEAEDEAREAGERFTKKTFEQWLEEARTDMDHPNHDEAQELKDLLEAAACGDANYPCESREDAERRIQEDPLSVQVRSDWHNPGERGEDSDFEILLCTGGPAVRIIGELQNGEPSRCWLEHQDWGTSWQEYITTGDDHAALLTYARCFYFGE